MSIPTAAAVMTPKVAQPKYVSKDFIAALPPRFRRHQVVRAVVDDQLAEVFGAVLDGGDPDIGIVDHMPPGFPPKWRGFVQAGIALLFDHGRPVADGLLDELHHIGFRLVSVTRGVVLVLAKVGTNVRFGNPADQIVIDSSDVQKVFGEGALVFLYLEIVLVFGKILGHGDQLIADLVPPLERLVRPRMRGTRWLTLRLALSPKTRAREGEHGDRNYHKRRPLYHYFLLWIDPLSF